MDPNLDLGFLVGLEVTQICVGQNELILRCHPIGAITIEGEWRLLNTEGVEVDQRIDHSERETSRIHKLLGERIDEYKIVSDRLLELRFSGGWVLLVEDSSDQYESFSIQYKDFSLFV